MRYAATLARTGPASAAACQCCACTVHLEVTRSSSRATPVSNLMKLAGNVLTALTLQCMGEVIALLRKSGVDADVAFDVLTGSLFDGKVHTTYGGKIATAPLE
jgi:hypothetical protein